MGLGLELIDVGCLFKVDCRPDAGFRLDRGLKLGYRGIEGAAMT